MGLGADLGMDEGPCVITEGKRTGVFGKFFGQLCVCTHTIRPPSQVWKKSVYYVQNVKATLLKTIDQLAYLAVKFSLKDEPNRIVFFEATHRNLWCTLTSSTSELPVPQHSMLSLALCCLLHPFVPFGDTAPQSVCQLCYIPIQILYPPTGYCNYFYVVLLW